MDLIRWMQRGLQVALLGWPWWCTAASPAYSNYGYALAGFIVQRASH